MVRCAVGISQRNAGEPSWPAGSTQKNMKQIRRIRDFECYDLHIRLKQQASMSTEECTKARCTVHPIIGSSGALFPTKEKVVGRARRGWDHELPILITLSLAFLQLCWPNSQFRSNGFHVDFTRIPSIEKLHVSPMATGCFAVLRLQLCLWITLNLFLLERKRLKEMKEILWDAIKVKGTSHPDIGQLSVRWHLKRHRTGKIIRMRRPQKTYWNCV